MGPPITLFLTTIASHPALRQRQEYLLRTLQVKKVKFSAYDLASDEQARKLWRRKAPPGKQDLPGYLVGNQFIGTVADLEKAVETNKFAEFLRLNEQWDAEIEGLFAGPLPEVKTVGVPGAHMPSEMTGHQASFNASGKAPEKYVEKREGEMDLGQELPGMGLDGVKVTEDEILQLVKELGLDEKDAANLLPSVGGKAPATPAPSPSKNKTASSPTMTQVSPLKGKNQDALLKQGDRPNANSISNGSPTRASLSKSVVDPKPSGPSAATPSIAKISDVPVVSGSKRTSMTSPEPPQVGPSAEQPIPKTPPPACSSPAITRPEGPVNVSPPAPTYVSAKVDTGPIEIIQPTESLQKSALVDVSSPQLELPSPAQASPEPDRTEDSTVDSPVDLKGTMKVSETSTVKTIAQPDPPQRKKTIDKSEGSPNQAPSKAETQQEVTQASTKKVSSRLPKPETVRKTTIPTLSSPERSTAPRQTMEPSSLTKRATAAQEAPPAIVEPLRTSKKPQPPVESSPSQSRSSNTASKRKTTSRNTNPAPPHIEERNSLDWVVLSASDTPPSNSDFIEPLQATAPLRLSPSNTSSHLSWKPTAILPSRRKTKKGGHASTIMNPIDWETVPGRNALDEERPGDLGF